MSFFVRSLSLDLFINSIVDLHTYKKCMITYYNQWTVCLVNTKHTKLGTIKNPRKFKSILTNVERSTGIYKRKTSCVTQQWWNKTWSGIPKGSLLQGFGFCHSKVFINDNFHYIKMHHCKKLLRYWCTYFSEQIVHHWTLCTYNLNNKSYFSFFFSHANLISLFAYIMWPWENAKMDKFIFTCSGNLTGDLSYMVFYMSLNCTSQVIVLFYDCLLLKKDAHENSVTVLFKSK